MDHKSHDQILPLNISDEGENTKKNMSLNISCGGSMMFGAGSLEPKQASTTAPDKKNSMIGVLFILVTCCLLTIGHTICKYLSIYSPYIKGNDISFFMGIFNFSFNLIYGLKYGISMNVLSFDFKVKLALLARMSAGFANNLVLVFAISRLPLSKSVIIFSLNPICCATLAFFFLKEDIAKTTIACFFGAAVGIYFLTLNRESDNKSGTISGYIAAITSIWLLGSIFIFGRVLALLKVHATVVCMCLGLSFMVPSLIASLFIDDVLHFNQYTTSDLCILTVFGFLSSVWITCMYLATKYAQASFISPILNLENVFTVFIDMFFFHYHFTGTDFLGMSILAACICIPIVRNYLNS
ncbi:unnamed protein product [Moneuplotes crassus]|uniref:EamA domain-containing protein n=1 Tax=Euplotes crassus TaxID=5936 RepID=A0AAD1XI18_EUPCR|nr:unnamed protein product [Moneuplotes crassus]